jgi:hypothetical protein
VIEIEKFAGHLPQAMTNFTIIIRVESRGLAGAAQTASIGRRDKAAGELLVHSVAAATQEKFWEERQP